jgi:hypothetical protein
MPDHPKTRPRDEGDDSDALTEHRRMLKALQEAAARLARAREVLNGNGNRNSREANRGDEPGREW